MKRIFVCMFCLSVVGSVCAQCLSYPCNVLLRPKKLVEDLQPPIQPTSVDDDDNNVSFAAVVTASGLEVTAVDNVGMVQLVVVNRLNGVVYNQMHTMNAADVVVIPTSTWSHGYYTINIYYGDMQLTGDFVME